VVLENDQGNQVQVLSRKFPQRGCKILIELVLVSPVRICSGVAGLLVARKGIQEPLVAQGSAGAIACHVSGRNQQPRKNRSFHDPDLLSAAPEFKERSGHDVFRVVVVPAQPICVPKDAITMLVIQHTERVALALALNTPMPQPLFAVSLVPHAL
jgi:hypothetical protein